MEEEEEVERGMLDQRAGRKTLVVLTSPPGKLCHVRASLSPSTTMYMYRGQSLTAVSDLKPWVSGTVMKCLLLCMT